MTTATKKLTSERAYSHGFESIYAVETIDTSTIRVLGPPKNKPAESQASIVQAEPELLDLTFTFLKTTIEPFFLRESIEILKLSSHAERYLRSLSYERIHDILNLDFNDMTFLKGLGQGHIEEIQVKLKEFVRGRSVKARKCIDYMSWARSCFLEVDKRVLGVVFERFGLMDHLPFSSAERVEIKKLPPEKKQEWLIQFKEASQNRQESFQKDLEVIFEVFVRPWMLARGGFASETELQELGWRLGEEREISEKVIDMFSALFCGGSHPFTALQPSAIPGVFAANDSSRKTLSGVVKVLNSYFYQNNLEYDFETLATWLEREFACAWIDLNPKIIKRVIELSKDYEILHSLVNKHRTVQMSKSN